MQPAASSEVQALLSKVSAIAEAVGLSGADSRGGGAQGSHGRRRLPVGHIRALLSRASINAWVSVGVRQVLLYSRTLLLEYPAQKWREVNSVMHTKGLGCRPRCHLTGSTSMHDTHCRHAQPGCLQAGRMAQFMLVPPSLLSV